MCVCFAYLLLAGVMRVRGKRAAEKWGVECGRQGYKNNCVPTFSQSRGARAPRATLFLVFHSWFLAPVRVSAQARHFPKSSISVFRDKRQEEEMSKTEVPSSLPGNVSLADHDPVMFDLIEKEKVGEAR